MYAFSWTESIKINNSRFHSVKLSFYIYIESGSTCTEVAILSYQDLLGV